MTNCGGYYQATYPTTADGLNCGPNGRHVSPAYYVRQLAKDWYTAQGAGYPTACKALCQGTTNLLFKDWSGVYIDQCVQYPACPLSARYECVYQQS